MPKYESDALRQFTRNIGFNARFRFETFFVKKGENECWLWEGSKDLKGYGCFGFDRKVWQAHRISYKIYITDPGWLFVLHDDDHFKSKACVNPNHLRLGTGHDNAVESFATGKQSNKGENHPLTTLIDREVLEIREKYRNGETMVKIANDFAIKWRVVQHIVKRRTWTHI